MIELQVFKPLDRQTAVVELWESGHILADVFAGDDGCRRLYLSDEGNTQGLNWLQLAQVVVRVSNLLDEADQQMKRTRE